MDSSTEKRTTTTATTTPIPIAEEPHLYHFSFPSPNQSHGEQDQAQNQQQQQQQLIPISPLNLSPTTSLTFSSTTGGTMSDSDGGGPLGARYGNMMGAAGEERGRSIGGSMMEEEGVEGGRGKGKGKSTPVTTTTVMPGITYNDYYSAPAATFNFNNGGSGPYVYKIGGVHGSYHGTLIVGNAVPQMKTQGYLVATVLVLGVGVTMGLGAWYLMALDA